MALKSVAVCGTAWYIQDNCRRASTTQVQHRFIARDSIYAKRAYAIAIPSVCLSVCPSVTRVDQSKTVEVRIMQFSPYSSPIPLVFPEILTDSP